MEYSKKRIINKPIPDNDPNGLLDVVKVSRDLTVKGVEVNVNIAHPYNGDISIELHSPDGKKKVLQSPTRVPGKNLNKTYKGEMMELFNGQKSKGEWKMKVVDAGAKDSGSVKDWTLHLHLANSKKTEIFVDDKEKLKSSQVCHQGGKITSVTAKVNIEHSHIGDLHCTLSAPSGKSVVLHNKTGGATKNLNKSFSTDELKDFAGETAKGKWTLEVSDTLKGDAGRLVSWGLDIKTTTSAPKPKKSKKDDLTKIEGIGPKINELLNKGGINSFEDLANAKNDTLKKILDDAGPRFKMHDPGSWPRQSKLAADGKWDELKKLQDELDGVLI
jgi:subtilisin-like proprotein convertase family protein